LNEGQQKTADGFFEFLMNTEQKELNISGPGGVGKTFLMGYLIDNILPRYHEICSIMNMPAVYEEVAMTATTNKAAEVLGKATRRPTSTIHSFLNIIVKENFDTGRSTLQKGRNWEVHHNKVIFVDEASMIDGHLLRLIREGTFNCKIVYVGDHCQLAPVFEDLSPVYKEGLPFYELTQPMRNSGQPALMAICNQLRQTVETQQFRPIRLVPGVIDLLDDDAMEQAVAEHFANPGNQDRILAYTNQRVMMYNNYIRALRELPEFFAVGEMVINNSAIALKTGMMSVEDEFEVTSVSEDSDFITIEHLKGQDPVKLEVRYCTLKGVHKTFEGVPVPVDRDHFVKLVKHYARTKNWVKYYHLKNNYPDLRPRDAATVHKAQGSTYDTVFIDLADLSTCRDPSQAARLLYVAFSRARQRVVLHGKLAPKFGGIVR